MTDPDDDLPTLTWGGPEQLVERLVREAQLIVLTEPVLCQKLYSALAAEGRAYAATAEGKDRRERLARSPLLARVRALWEPATFNLLEEDPGRPLPSAYVDALTVAVDLPQLESLLALLATRSPGGSHGG